MSEAHDQGQTSGSVTVYKVGGSTLRLPHLPERLQQLLEMRRDQRVLLVIGGGAAADLVREWDRQFKLGDDRAHWLALRAMMLNEALLAEILPGTRIVHDRSQAEASWREHRVPVLCAHSFLRTEERNSEVTLPHDWRVTSDSIAAWVALLWPAGELVLLKSVDAFHAAGPQDPPPVDPWFHELAPRLKRVQWVNLRSERPEPVELKA